MHVAIFTNNYLPNPYGVSTSVEGFRQGLTQAGHTVTNFAPQRDGHENDAPGVYRYPAVSVPTKVPFTIAYPHAHGALNDVLRETQWDIAHVQHPTLLGAEGRRWAQRKNTPVVFTWHSLYDRYTHYVPFVPHSIAGSVAMKQAAHFAQKCDHVIAPTQSVVDVMRAAGVAHNRVSVIPSPVDAALFAAADGATVRQQYGIAPETMLFVTISRLTQEKNVQFLMRAMVRVLTQMPQAIFLCAGEGDERDALAGIAQEYGVTGRVIFPGKVARGDIKQYLAAANLFVYASTSETQGTILTEAMWCGAPIVAVRATGVCDVVRDGETGVLVAEDEAAFASAVCDLCTDTVRQKNYARNAVQVARNIYSVETCTQKLVDTYHRAIASYRTSDGRYA